MLYWKPLNNENIKYDYTEIIEDVQKLRGTTYHFLRR